MNQKGKKLFVTVGSTKFESLINTILKTDTLNTLKTHSFTSIKLQVGNGHHTEQKLESLSNDSTVKFTSEEVAIEAYRYKNSIKEDMRNADLVISHAGSGSIMESLEAGKKLIVVVNEDLMDNHQLELAEKMFDEGYLLYTKCQGLREMIEKINEEDFSMLEYSPGQPKLFGKYIEKMFE